MEGEKRVLIRFNGYEARIVGDLPSRVDQVIAANLTWIDKNESYANKKRRFYVDPSKCIYYLPQRKFLTGLIPRVAGILETAGYEVEYRMGYEYVEPEPCEIPEWAYTHQREMVAAALENCRCILQATTGAGKTISAVFIIQWFPNSRILFTVPTKTLLSKTVKVLEEFLGERVGRVGDSFAEWQRVTVGIINSLSKRREEFKKELSSINILLTDESHRAASSLYTSVGEYCINTCYRIGLTGTAFRSDGSDIVMEGVLGPIVYKTREDSLSELGVIMQPTYITAVTKHEEIIYPGAREITEGIDGKPLENPICVYDTENGKPERALVYEASLVGNKYRNDTVCAVALSFLNNPHRTGGVLILVEWVVHGELLRDLFREKYDLDVPFIYGGTRTKERLKQIELLREREIDILIASSILNEGEDIPSVQMGIIAGGGSNEKNIVQQVGRIIRTSPGKKFALVVDFHDEERYYLRSNSIKRRGHIASRYKDIRAEMSVEDVCNLVRTISVSPYYKDGRKEKDEEGVR